MRFRQIPASIKAVAGGWRDRHPSAARILAGITTVLAAALVLFALLVPNTISHITPGAFVRIPLEAIFGVAVLLALPAGARRVVAALAGLGVGLVLILKLLDMGYYTVLRRTFDPVLDWMLFDDAEAFLRESIGTTGAVAAVVGVVALVVAVLVLMPLAVVWLGQRLANHRVAALRATLVVGTAWMFCATVGVWVGGQPVASMSTMNLVRMRAHQVRASLADEQKFAKEARVDALKDTPADQMLTALRGKDVVFAFIESYGRCAVQDPQIAPQVDAALADGTRRLQAAGFSSRSAFLTSSTTGAGSWLAESTFLSGLWINSQQRYRTATSHARLTLPSAFGRTNAWRTVDIMPGTTRAWPEGTFYNFDKIYDGSQLGYKGPKFSWSTMPDQYTMEAFERLEHGKQDRKPLMADVVLTSSHNPWAPLPRMVAWNEVGDGSVYDAIHKAGKDPVAVWKHADDVRTEYGRSIAYSLDSLLSWVEKYGDDNTVLVFLGDHQPNATVTRDDPNRDVPISIVAHDQSVLNRISSWGWQDGLKPGPNAPVWRMDKFRNRFLTTYGAARHSAPPPLAH